MYNVLLIYGTEVKKLTAVFCSSVDIRDSSYFLSNVGVKIIRAYKQRVVKSSADILCDFTVTDPDRDLVKCRDMVPNECHSDPKNRKACGKATDGLTVNVSQHVVYEVFCSQSIFHQSTPLTNWLNGSHFTLQRKKNQPLSLKHYEHLAIY